LFPAGEGEDFGKNPAARVFTLCDPIEEVLP
jgi:hypothetical protein